MVLPPSGRGAAEETWIVTSVPIDRRTCAAALLLFAAASLSRAQSPPDPASGVPTPPKTKTTADGVKQMKALYAQHRYQETARVAEGLVREHRDDPDAWVALANIHLASDWAFRREDRALTAAERAFKLAGKRTDVMVVLATAHFRLGEYDAALPLVGELVDAKPPKLDPKTLTDLLVIRAEMALRRESLEPKGRSAAMADLERAINSTPTDARARSLRAEARMQDGEFELAFADLQVAERSLPGGKQVQYLLQTCLSRMGRKDEARRHHEIWRRINRLMDSQGSQTAPDPEERRRIMRELKELNSADLENRIQLARLELELGNADASIAECDELLKLNPNWAAAIYLRAAGKQVKAGAKPPCEEKRDRGDDADGGGK
jgi:tetratricopeptide (TPR) repeat protein